MLFSATPDDSPFTSDQKTFADSNASAAASASGSLSWTSADVESIAASTATDDNSKLWRLILKLILHWMEYLLNSGSGN